MLVTKTYFNLTQDHLKLLQRMHIDWYDCEYGAPSVDPKRPYGNSSVELDIAEILEWELNENEELSEEQSELAKELHDDTRIALQICLYLLKFETGVYEKTSNYSDRSWVKIK